MTMHGDESESEQMFARLDQFRENERSAMLRSVVVVGDTIVADVFLTQAEFKRFREWWDTAQLKLKGLATTFVTGPAATSIPSRYDGCQRKIDRTIGDRFRQWLRRLPRTRETYHGESVP